MKPIDQAYAGRGLVRLGAAMKLLQVDRAAITHLVNQRQLTLVEFDWKNGKQRGIPLGQLKNASAVYQGGSLCLRRGEGESVTKDCKLIAYGHAIASEIQEPR